MNYVVDLIRRIMHGISPAGNRPPAVSEAPAIVPAAPVETTAPPDRIARIAYFDNLCIKVHPGDIITEGIAHSGVWEEDLSERIISIGKNSGGLLVDVGANVGYFSLLWAAGNPRNRSYAFEASPRIFPMLLDTVKRNGLDQRISTFGVALSDTAGLHSFVLGREGYLEN